MRHTHFIRLYGMILVPCALAVVALLQLGSFYYGETAAALPTGANTAAQAPLPHPVRNLLLQIIVIIGAVKCVGLLMKKIRQPAVVGEMLAGILLGPSLLGLVAPGVEQFLFPPSSLDTLNMLSQLGIIVFMFLVGLELDLASLRQRTQVAVIVSHASMIAPFLLSTVLSLALFPLLSSPAVGFLPFALFMGTAMSVTAFPVLARIIEERGMSGTKLGTCAIGCAAVDDITAWCLLAAVVAITRAQGFGGTLTTLLLTVLFVGALLVVVQPLLARLVDTATASEKRQKGLATGLLTLAFGAALCTEIIGIHALFGAFCVGAIIPRHTDISRFLKERMETFCRVLLLPIFFTYTGLRTQVGLLGDAHDWWICAGIVAVAVAGKLVGSGIAARWTGMSWRESAAMGALMNTRGLMELVVLNVGYELGIISPTLFTMLVIMALVTTCMTGPLLDFLLPSPSRERRYRHA